MGKTLRDHRVGTNRKGHNRRVNDTHVFKDAILVAAAPLPKYEVKFPAQLTDAEYEKLSYADQCIYDREWPMSEVERWTELFDQQKWFL